MSIDVEYAIKQDIRNNPIVREVDWQQKQEFLRTVCLTGFIVVLLLFWACQQFETVHSGYALSSLRTQRASEDALNRQLRLEVESLRAPQRIEPIAVQQLHMAAPGSDRTLVIERATAPIASKAIVATVR